MYSPLCPPIDKVTVKKTHTHTGVAFRMAESAYVTFDGAIKNLHKVTEVSGNLRNDLKKLILQSISDLQAAFLTLQEENRKLTSNPSNVVEVRKETYAKVTGSASPKISIDQVPKSFKAILKTKTNKNPIDIVKQNLNPVTLQLGIKSLKTLKNGQALVETFTKNDLDKIIQETQNKCKGEIETNEVNKVNPRLIIFNLPNEITKENLAVHMRTQNDIEDNHKIECKYLGKTKMKGTAFAVIEVNPELRKIILKDKQIKLFWNVCNCQDYIHVPRCFRCSRFHNNYKECHEDVTCPLCAGNHPLKDCRAPKADYKCINCTNHNNHSRGGKQHKTDHTALDKECPCYKQLVSARISNTKYE